MTELTVEGSVMELLLREDKTLGSVAQAVAITLSTPKGTVPGYREFGTEQNFLDLPIPAATVAAVNPIREAVEKWNENVTVKNVRFRYENDRLVPIVDIIINEEADIEV